MVNIKYLWNRIVEIDPSMKRKPELPSDSFCSGFINKLVMKTQNRIYLTGKDSILFKHGLSNSRIHNIWKGILTRITNKNCKDYKYYGGRGINICDEWMTFTNFYQWAINNGYNDKLVIDRIEVNGNYEPSNCRFITRQISSQNTRKKTDRGIYFNGYSYFVRIRYMTKYYYGGCNKDINITRQLRDKLLIKLNQ